MVLNKITIKNLRECPKYRREVLRLVSTELSYPENQDISVDFLPLYSSNNANHNHILLDGKNLIGHLGFLPRIMTVNNQDIPVTFVGGLALKPPYRGKKIFSKYFSTLLNQYDKKSTLFFLWGDKTSLYNHFNFYECGTIYQYEINHNYQSTKYQNKKHDLNWIKKIYNNFHEKHFFSLKRNSKTWNEIEKITSTNLHIKENQFYCYSGKGGDLKNTIHELFYENESQLNEYLNHVPANKVWSPAPIRNLKGPTILFSAMVKIGDLKLFEKFIQIYSNGEIELEGCTNDKVHFKFEGNDFSLSHNDFLQGLFGPNHIKEFGHFAKNIFISGLDSI